MNYVITRHIILKRKLKEAIERGITMTMPDTNSVDLLYKESSYKIRQLRNVLTRDLEKVIDERLALILMPTRYKNVEEEMYFYGSSVHRE